MNLLTWAFVFCPFKPCPWEAYAGFGFGVVFGAAAYAIVNKLTEKK
jgi:hypothetical protein